MKNFVSVGTGSARYQDLSRNPQKLAGQCAKLKCCMNYEVDQYVEAYRKLPPRDIQLQSMEGDYFFFKCDILLGMVTYSTDKRMAANLVTVSAQRAMDIIEMNKRGEKPETLEEGGHKQPERAIDLATQEDLNRFDKKKKKKKKNNGGNGKPQREEAETAAVEQDKNTQNERPREQRHQQAHNANANNSSGGEQNRRRPSRPHAPRSRENNNHKAPRKDRE